MATIFRYETQIDSSNKAFMHAIDQHAKTGKSFYLFHLIAQYAFETLFFVTTGQSPGFMSGLDITSLENALEEWKFISVVSGSYLRFHAAVTRILRSFDYTKFDKQILQYLKIIKKRTNSQTLRLILKRTTMICIESIASRAACAALIVAASDPIITHTGAALFYIYHDITILKNLRAEIAEAKMTDKVTLKEILLNKSKMPLLYSCIRESLRQWRQHTERSISPSDLVSESAIFGQSDLPNDLHLAILTKIIIKVVMKFDMAISAPVGEFGFSSATQAVTKYRTKPEAAAPAAVRKEKANVWRAFAVDTATAYKKAVDEYKPAETVQKPAEYEIKETFRLRRKAPVVEERVEATSERKVVPPHLRMKK